MEAIILAYMFVNVVLEQTFLDNYNIYEFVYDF